MSELLHSIENELELKAIERNNSLVERQLANFQRQRDEINRSLRNLESCNSQVGRMALIIKDKSAKVKNDVDMHLAETHDTVQKSFASLNSSFEHVDLIRAINHLSFHYGSPDLVVTLPYDKCIETKMREENKLRSAIDDIAVPDGLNIEKENLAKTQQATMKDKVKYEKEMNRLQEELQRQTGIASLLQSSSTEINKQLQISKNQLEECNEKKATADFEMKEAENKREEVLQQLSENEIVTAETIAALDDIHSVLTAENCSYVSPKNNFPDLEEIALLFDEWKSLTEENDDFPQTVSISDKETSKSLETSLGSVKKDVKQTLKSIEQMRDCSSQFSAINDALSEKKSGLEAVRKQIAENTSVLTKLKVTENAVRISNSESRSSKKEEILRRLEATRNDVPGPVPYQPYQTPGQSVPSSKTEMQNVKVLKKSSFGSGSTRNISNTGPQYPGIKLIAKPNAKVAPISQKEASDDLDVSINSDNSSLISEDSGTTQDESAINQLFSPLGNDKQPSPPVVEFSMADHMTEFSQRQAKIKADKSNLDIVVDIHKDEEIDLNELDISAIDSDGEDVEELDEDDDDDDLFAPDDQDMDQSTWGDDD